MTSNHHKTSKLSWLSKLLLLISFSLVACTTGDCFNEYQRTGSDGWPVDSMLVFDFNATDSLAVCDMYLQLRHTGRYPYQNLWMQVELTDPDSSLISRDTLELRLADESGNWLGAGSGLVYQMEIPYRLSTVFARSGNYGFKLSHCMNDTLLKGVTHAGLRISYQHGKK